MAVSPVDICNLALSALGDPAGISSIDPPDDSAQAHYCATYYPIALQTALSHGWSFATRRAKLAQISPDTTDWQYCFRLPNDNVSVISVNNGLTEFSQELHSSNVSCIYANEADMHISYISSAPPSGVYPPLFIEVLSLTLQYFLAGSIIKGDVGASAKNQIYKLLQVAIAAAKNKDGMNYRPQNKYIPSITRVHDSAFQVIGGEIDPYYPSGYTVVQ